MRVRKLTDEQAAEIRRRYAEPGISQQGLATEFGVSQAMIHAIVHGKRYTGGPGRIYAHQVDPEDRVCRICQRRKLIAAFPLIVRKTGYSWRETQCHDCIRAKDRRRYESEAALHAKHLTWQTWQERVRVEVIEHYGSCCACCGERTYEFLGIDHIDGGGRQHRKEVGDGARFYAWIIRNGFPSNLRLACHNCNLARGFYGACPHEVERRRKQIHSVPSP